MKPESCGQMVLRFTTLLVLAALAACGGGGGGGAVSPTPTGRVVKGPVFNATVTFSGNPGLSAVTDSQGHYVFPAAPVGTGSSVGGLYVPLGADGSPLPAAAAPPMKTPAGVANFSPLSTLVASASAGDAQKIMNVLNGLGGSDLNSDLSVKTSQNAAALVLSEAIGAALQQAATGESAGALGLSDALAAALATEVGNLPGTTGTANIVANVQAAVNAAVNSTAVAAVIAANPTLNLAAPLNAAAGTAAQGASNLPIGAALPTTNATGTNGGTGIK